MTVRVLVVAAVIAVAAPAHGWEADTTHAGLTEQAIATSKLHERLRDQFGRDLGTFAPLIIPPADAPALFKIFARLNPTHGYVPDTRGRQAAGAWLVAGSVVADIPVAAARNHFFDAFTRQGLKMAGAAYGPLSIVANRLGKRAAKRYIGGGDGVAATAWIEHADNPLSLARFREQYRKAVLARTEGERDRHLASALLAAGATLHVLQDMGSPSHARNDIGAHMESLGLDSADVGSRFERIAALGYGRLGVPASEPVARPSAIAYFTADDGGGLADRTARAFFSNGSLPRSIELPRGARPAELQTTLERALRRPGPAPVTAALDLIRAARPGGATFSNEAGTCVAQYAVRDSVLSWLIDDDCALTQEGEILPTVSGYSAGLLDFVFRGALAVTADRGAVAVSVAGVELGKGTITVLWDDARRVRTALGKPVATTGGTLGATLGTGARLPKTARYVAALFEGVDAAGQPVLASGFLNLTSSK